MERKNYGKRDEALDSMHGWLDLSGNYYGCNESGHEVLAELLVERFELKKGQNRYCADGDVLFKNGWQKCGKYGWIIKNAELTMGDFEITRRQYDVIIRWCDKHQKPYPAFLQVDGENVFPRRKNAK